MELYGTWGAGRGAEGVTLGPTRKEIRAFRVASRTAGGVGGKAGLAGIYSGSSQRMDPRPVRRGDGDDIEAGLP